MKQYLTTKEVARILGVHVRTVGNWIRAGKLRAIRIGKAYRIAWSDLDTFLEERSTKEP